MKIIVFGGSGFLGSHVADALSAKGHEVLIFDARPSPYRNQAQEMIVGDILDEELVKKSVSGCDAVYNFAGISDIDECVSRPIEAIKFNIVGNAILLEAAREAKVKRFVFASSVYVYSDAGAVYRTTKQSCELFIETYYHVHKLPYTIVRYGSLYGDRADMRNSIYKHVYNALSQGKIIYHGDGDEIREFIHVRDAAELSVRVLGPEFENQHVILTGHRAMQYGEILAMIKEMAGKPVEIEYHPKTSETHYKTTPYSFNPKLGKKLANNPYIDLGQGLLGCMREIHKNIHREQHEEMGYLVEDGESGSTAENDKA
jgi:UDP-glucose 4-epimerase